VGDLHRRERRPTPFGRGEPSPGRNHVRCFIDPLGVFGKEKNDERGCHVKDSVKFDFFLRHLMKLKIIIIIIIRNSG